MLKAALNSLRPQRYHLLLPLRVWIRSWGHTGSSAAQPPVIEEETVTANIRSAGCYFLISEEPVVGSKVEMEITMAPNSKELPGAKVICRGRVVRIEKGQDRGKTGVGCAIERYRLVPAAGRS